ncbi:histidinol phosphatase [Flagellimonas hymeniacidonis]|uniref:protein-tyrosine-phosphatase n=1 Tax=Flagellimonas hymeniacidonis TaxID=2603628 RepID=A0A5C8V635_9FLAO|nr:CpsB/CapC family capsule biosynthesis tyrosine phosphatase [Flagellimonas hymeniacidonis]TXN35957.1 histidinol phosphatase [Flagellimonas hymeniacidonis]
MFSFFHKKIFLVDYLHGLVDMHNHILPGIDDGAKTVEDSINLIKGFSELGITNFVCTPHIMNHYYPNTLKTIKPSFDAVVAELSTLKMDYIKIDYSAEYMIDDAFESLLEERSIVPLRVKYLLIEMSYLQPSFNFDNAITDIAKHGYYPILAHPERYVYFHKEYKTYTHLKNQGILFQLNLMSLGSESYGTEVQKVSQKLLEDGCIDYIASDVHNKRQLNLLREIKISNKTLKLILPVIENTINAFY